MAEYIEKDKAVGIAHGYCHTKDGRCCGPDDVVELYEELKSIPAADVVEVRHGKWIEENTRLRSSQFCCSVCHRTAYDPQPTRLKDWKKRCRYAYCPNCGAKMTEDYHEQKE